MLQMKETAAARSIPLTRIYIRREDIMDAQTEPQEIAKESLGVPFQPAQEAERASLVQCLVDIIDSGKEKGRNPAKTGLERRRAPFRYTVWIDSAEAN